MATYYALTSENPRTAGYHVIAAGSDRTEVERDAYAEVERQYGPLTRRLEDAGDPGGRPGWIDPTNFARTAAVNLVVVSKSEARRRYGITDWHYQAWLGVES